MVGGIAERFAGVRMKTILPTTRLVGLFSGGGKRLVGGFRRAEFVHLQTDHWLWGTQYTGSVYTSVALGLGNLPRSSKRQLLLLLLWA